MSNLFNEMMEESSEKDKKIADLEAKLAESEKALEAKESVNQMYKATLSLKDSDFSDLVRENAQLKQQLAKEQKHISRLKNMNKSHDEAVGRLTEENNQLKQQLAEYEAIKNKYKTIFLDRFVDAKVEDARIWKEEYDKLQQQLADKEKEIERWHNNYKQRDRQFQSVRQRYHLLNRLQAKYHDKHKLHLSEMQCLELVEENEKLQQDKISFAVEQLDKVKEYVMKSVEEFSCVYEEDMLDEIDNQIEELKKEMK